MKRLVLLGSTGSIGEQTLSVVADFPERFRVTALAAGRNVARLAEQVRRFHPERVAVAEETRRARSCGLCRERKQALSSFGKDLARRAKSKCEHEFNALGHDLDEMTNEARMSEEKAQRAMIDAAR